MNYHTLFYKSSVFSIPPSTYIRTTFKSVGYYDRSITTTHAWTCRLTTIQQHIEMRRMGFCMRQHVHQEKAKFCMWPHGHFRKHSYIYDLLHIHAEFGKILAIMRVHAANTFAFICESYYLHELARLLHASTYKNESLAWSCMSHWKTWKIAFICMSSARTWLCMYYSSAFIRKNWSYSNELACSWVKYDNFKNILQVYASFSIFLARTRVFKAFTFDWVARRT